MKFKSSLTDKPINKSRINKLKYALSELQGIIIGVFKLTIGMLLQHKIIKQITDGDLMVKMP
jgi:hypothetical protein